MPKHRVLLADTDKALLASYRDCLSRNGFLVATATSGLECVAQLRKFAPELVVLNPDIPWGSGDGVLACMHEDADVPLVPVVVLADHYGDDNLYPVGVFPVRAYYSKPLPPSVLAESIRRLLKKQIARRSARSVSGRTPSLT